MAPYRTVGKRGEGRSLIVRGKGAPHEAHPTGLSPAPASAPARTGPEGGLQPRGQPHRLRGNVYVDDVYVDDDRNYRFVAVATGGVMGWLGTRHRLVPVEAIAEGEASSVTLRV